VRVKDGDIERKLRIVFSAGVRTTDPAVLGNHPTTAEEDYQEYYPNAHVE